MENQTYEQDYILYLINRDENTISIIGNTLDSVNTTQEPKHFIKQYSTILPNNNDENESKPNIFSRMFSLLFGNKQDNEHEMIINTIDNFIQKQNSNSWLLVKNNVTKICENSFYFLKKYMKSHLQIYQSFK